MKQKFYSFYSIKLIFSKQNFCYNLLQRYKKEICYYQFQLRI